MTNNDTTARDSEIRDRALKLAVGLLTGAECLIAHNLMVEFAESEVDAAVTHERKRIADDVLGVAVAALKEEEPTIR